MNKLNKLYDILGGTECLTCGGTYSGSGSECMCDVKGKMPHWFIPPILIGTVLDKTDDRHWNDIVILWSHFGHTNFLQTIFAEKEWIDVRTALSPERTEQLKSKPKQKLYDFLCKLFIN